MNGNFKPWLGPRRGKIPNKRVFNRFFRVGDTDEGNLEFKGVNFTYKIAKKLKHSRTWGDKIQNDNRYFRIEYIGFAKHCYFWFIQAFPSLIAGIGIFFWFSILFFSLDTTTPHMPVKYLCIMVLWNFFWLNFRFLFDWAFNRFQGAYIDRQNQTFCFTWDIENGLNKNEFGHTTFPFKDIEAFEGIKTFFHANSNGVVTSTSSRQMLTIRNAYYKSAFIDMLTKNNSPSRSDYNFEWEYMLRFVDTSLPLPDVAELEKFRHLDAVTVQFDQENRRPEYYWRLMHKTQEKNIEEEIKEELDRFYFNSAYKPPSRIKSKLFKKQRNYKLQKYDQDEIKKIWEVIPIESKHFKKASVLTKFKQRGLLLLRQMTIAW